MKTLTIILKNIEFTVMMIGGEYFETDVTNYTTPNGEEIVAVCYYGYDS